MAPWINPPSRYSPFLSRPPMNTCHPSARSHPILSGCVSASIQISVEPSAFPLQGRFSPGAFPPRALPRFISTMPHLTSRSSSRWPRYYPCSSVLPLPEERPGSPTFTGPLLRHAVLSDPEEATRPLPMATTVMVSSEKLTSSTLPQVSLTGLHHFSLAAYGLPHPCLRLTPAVTGSRLKTRYEMGWVGPFSVALSATSEPAPRGALTF
jgi:hypothetical protein